MLRHAGEQPGSLDDRRTRISPKLCVRTFSTSRAHPPLVFPARKKAMGRMPGMTMDKRKSKRFGQPLIGHSKKNLENR
jgi:hypothetical protein